jgi:hypothetical protein
MDAAALQTELARQDAAAAAALARVDTLMNECAQLAGRDAAVRSFLVAWPDEQARRATELQHGHDELARARHEVEQSTAALAEAERHRDATRLTAARRAHEHALADELAAGEHEARLTTRVAALAAERDAILRERDLLLGLAERLSDALHDVPRLAARSGFPIETLEALPAWASAVRAALLVARSGLAAERESLLRQSEELAAVTARPS